MGFITSKVLIDFFGLLSSTKKSTHNYLKSTLLLKVMNHVLC